MSNFSYQDYVADESFLEDYNSYQQKYAKTIRESDKVLLSLIDDFVSSRGSQEEIKLLDIGCSTGNLLLHIKNHLPQLTLVGGDLAESSLEICRNNPDLRGVDFEVMNILALPSNAFHVIAVNAVLYMMEDAEFNIALENLYSALIPGGMVIIFDFFHPYPQDIHINEISKSHPHGLRLRFRPMEAVKRLLDSLGFEGVTFRPFTLPIDLSMSGDPEDLITYTLQTTEGKKLPFRGTLFQPWCHLSILRPS